METIIGHGGDSPRSSSDDASVSVNIEKIINLKLLLVDQRATIDALTPGLYNTEPSHHKARRGDQERLRTAEEENRRQARLLDKEHEEGRGMRSELEWEREGRLLEALFGRGRGGDREGEETRGEV